MAQDESLIGYTDMPRKEVLNALKGKRVHPDKEFTHCLVNSSTIKSIPSSRYVVEDDKELLEEFGKKGGCNLLEKPPSISPLRFMFSFSWSLDQGDKQKVSDEKLIEVSKIVQEKVGEVFESVNSKQLSLVIVRMEEPVKNGQVIIDNAYIFFPHIFCESWVGDKYLRPRINEAFEQEHVWKGLKLTTSYFDILEQQSNTMNWPVFGSLGMRKLICIGKRGKPVDKEVFFKTSGYNDDEDIPALLSVRGESSQTQLTDEVASYRAKFLAGNKGRSRKRYRTDAEVEADLRRIKDAKFIQLLSPERTRTRGKWLDVGQVLVSITEGHTDGLMMWIDLTERGGVFTEDDCASEWNGLPNRLYTIRSLSHMAATDSPTRHKEYVDMLIRKKMENSLFDEKPSELSVSRVVEAKYDGKFISSDSKRDSWYTFNGTYYYSDDGKNGSTELRKIIHTEILEEYSQYHIDLCEMAKKELNPEEKSRFETRAIKCKAIITALGKVKFASAIVDMMRLWYDDKKFWKMHDEKRGLIGFENGVMDLELGIFREGRPDDYITLSAGYNYPVDISEDDDIVIATKEFLAKVLPIESVRLYFMDALSRIPAGGNRDKVFLVMTGGTNGGKSATLLLLEHALGGYAGKFPRESGIQSRGNSSSSARPELARVRGKKAMVMQELTQESNFNVGWIKEVTGNDSFFARNIYEKGSEIKPQFILLLFCNTPPNIPNHDEAFCERLRLIPFVSRFVKKDLAPKTKKEQREQHIFPADRQLNDKLEEMGPAFMYLLIKRYLETKGQDLVEPKEVLASIDEYKSQNDVIQQFVDQRIVQDEDAELSLGIAYLEFTAWYKECYPAYNRGVQSRPEFMKNFSRVIGAKFEGGKFKWKGFKIADEDGPSTGKDARSQLKKRNVNDESEDE